MSVSVVLCCEHKSCDHFSRDWVPGVQQLGGSDADATSLTLELAWLQSFLPGRAFVSKTLAVQLGCHLRRGQNRSSLGIVNQVKRIAQCSTIYR
jgi:hypothetical protein